MIKNLIKPGSKDEDSRRREYIINIILASSIALFGVASFFAIFRFIFKRASFQGNLVSLSILIIFFCLFFFLLWLSKKGYFVISSFILIFLYFVAVTFTAVNWGVELQYVLLSYALIIVISGILISTRFAFTITGIISVLVIAIAYGQVHYLINPDYRWKSEIMTLPDSILYAAIFWATVLVSWLSNREIEKSLIRARKSERELKKERDLLEVRVEERTKELKIAQLEKMKQMSNFAEMGRLASGIVHDLVNPLTAVSLNLEQLKETNPKKLEGTRKYLQEAIRANREMQNFIISVRKQIQHQEIRKSFSVTREIEEVIKILSYKSHTKNIEVELEKEGASFTLVGNPLKFHQFITNLISNAIDAYKIKEDQNNEQRKVLININRSTKTVDIKITDWGSGIAEENLAKIFDPFFTTKDAEEGTGIGLSITKNIIENDFKGLIKVSSKPGEGTTFNVSLPVLKQ